MESGCGRMGSGSVLRVSVEGGEWRRVLLYILVD